MDLSTIIGTVSALLFVAFAAATGGNLLAFIDVPSLVIVLLGTTALTMGCFSWETFARLPTTLKKILFQDDYNIEKCSAIALELSEISFKKGFLFMEKQLPATTSYPVLNNGIAMIIDNHSADYMANILSNNITTTAESYGDSIAIFNKAAEISPAMGLTGTLIGLVQMLGKLTDIGQIGQSMALALLTTFYGAVMSYVICYPVAAKLEYIANKELNMAKMCFKIVMSIAKKESPRDLRKLLHNITPGKERIVYL